MKIVREIGNMVLAFLLCLSVIGVFLLVLFSNTLMRKEYLLKQLEQNGYYEKIEVDLKNGIEEYQYQSGFSSEVFENLYTREMIKADVDAVADYLYEGKAITTHAASVEEKMRENIKQYLDENHISLTVEQQKNVDDFVDIIVKVYEKKIHTTSNYSEKIAKVRENVQDVIKMLQIALGVVFIGILVVILWSNWKEIWGSVNTIAVGLLSTGILLQLMKNLVVKNFDIENILLLSQSLSNLGKEVIYDILAKVQITGILLMMIGIVLIMIANAKKNRED